MKTIIRFIFLLIGVCWALASQAQFDPDQVCRIENGQLVFSLNLKWSVKERKEVSQLFDLDSALISQVYAGKININLGGEIWKVRKTKSNVVELSKPIISTSNQEMKVNDVFLVIDKWVNFAGKLPESDFTFGVNKLEVANSFMYKNNVAWWFLPGHQKAGKVYISGSFNNWSTTKNPMKFVGTGWTAELNLKPGRYLYKFIVDGRWMSDPSNKLKEDDGADGNNSVLFCYNHKFELKGYTNAKKVVVTGNFLNWDPKGMAMNRTSDGWSLPVYLREGSYAYKFIVDNQWMPDPANRDTRSDGNGNQNSFLGIGEAYVFKLDNYLTAKQVILTGSFNGWNESELVMDKTAKGWQLPYVVAAGNYEYKFIVDGRWTTDPVNPFLIGSGDTENSFIGLKANHIFELSRFLDAKKVLVSGSFNGWNKDGYRMIRQGGKWIFPIYLKPGKYTYKFVVDGDWILDPANKLYEQNEYDTGNSVLWIDGMK